MPKSILDNRIIYFEQKIFLSLTNLRFHPLNILKSISPMAPAFFSPQNSCLLLLTIGDKLHDIVWMSPLWQYKFCTSCDMLRLVKVKFWKYRIRLQMDVWCLASSRLLGCKRHCREVLFHWNEKGWGRTFWANFIRNFPARNWSLVVELKSPFWQANFRIVFNGLLLDPCGQVLLNSLTIEWWRLWWWPRLTRLQMIKNRNSWPKVRLQTITHPWTDCPRSIPRPCSPNTSPFD